MVEYWTHNPKICVRLTLETNYFLKYDSYGRIGFYPAGLESLYPNGCVGSIPTTIEIYI